MTIMPFNVINKCFDGLHQNSCSKVLHTLSDKLDPFFCSTLYATLHSKHRPALMLAFQYFIVHFLLTSLVFLLTHKLIPILSRQAGISPKGSSLNFLSQTPHSVQYNVSDLYIIFRKVTNKIWVIPPHGQAYYKGLTTHFSKWQVLLSCPWFWENVTWTSVLVCRCQNLQPSHRRLCSTQKAETYNLICSKSGDLALPFMCQIVLPVKLS